MLLYLIVTSLLSHFLVKKLEEYFYSWFDMFLILAMKVVSSLVKVWTKLKSFFSDRGNRLFYLYLVIVVHLLLLKTAYGEEIALSPPYYCPNKMPTNWMTPSVCYRSCDLEGLSPTPVNLTIHQHDIKDAIGILECKKWVSQITATETWTFSKLPPKREDKPARTNAEECWNQFTKVCKGLECESSRPELKAEYSYAADTVKQYTWFQLRYKIVTVPISYDDGSYIRLDGHNLDYTAGQAVSPNDPDKLLLWKVKTAVECWTSPVTTLQCNQVLSPTGVVSQYICGHGRLIITPGKELSSRHCTYKVPTFISEEGIIYNKASGTVVAKDGLPIFKDSLLPAMKEIVIQHRIHSLMLQEQVCKHSCLSPFPNQTNSMFFYGNKRVARLSAQEFLSCLEDLTCQILRPLHVCSDSNLIAVVCSGIMTWWDPSLIYVNPYHYCSGTSVERQSLRFQANAGVYLANMSGVYYLGGSELQHQIHLPTVERKLTLLGKEEIQRAMLSSASTVKPETESGGQEVNRGSWNFGIVSFIEGIEHRIKAWIIMGLCTVVAVFMFLYIFPVSLRGKKKYQEVPYALREF
ncbi:glycoprotein [Cucurbit cytorhabdovirus 1]|uniref:glycoprotein n=1 Tax=Cucurbit cytorhabdovirus 1 TaxID=2730538 RepID=UPI002481AB7D|nr:glycoprotein [Cucurbit cytorhabdovirus 1]QLT57529.1 glycoprotein [Cucurbit cytorhabdovirus 1]